MVAVVRCSRLVKAVFSCAARSSVAFFVVIGVLGMMVLAMEERAVSVASACVRASASVGGGGVKERSSSKACVCAFQSQRRVTRRCSSEKAT